MNTGGKSREGKGEEVQETEKGQTNETHSLRLAVGVWFRTK